MIDLVDNVAAFLKANGYDAHLGRLDGMAGKEGVLVRRLPSRTSADYYNGGEEVKCVYQVVSRRRSEHQALTEAAAMKDLLRNAEIPSENGSYTFTSQRIYTHEQELYLSDNGFFAYEFRMEATIEI